MYLFQRNFEKAEEVWLRLEEIQPNSPRTHLQLGTLYFCLDKENPLYEREKATEKIEYAWNLNREETGSPLLLSKITLLNGDMETAGKLLDAVISTNLMDYQARYLKGLLEWVGGEDQKSREMFREARDIYQSLAYSEVQGEGTTETGARAMLSEDRFCDPFEIRIGELLGGDEMLNHQDQYEKFSMSMEAWRELEKGIR